MSKLKLLELFGGIRACSKALERLGIDYECVDYVEIDKSAVRNSNLIYNTNFCPQNIRSWDKDLQVDLIMHGSPCQDFSIAGKNLGGDYGSNTRSSLMYETIRIVKKLKPKYVIWENVKNLLSSKHKHNFQLYLEIMDELGYNNYYQLLNAKDYGIPQSRERIFVVSIRKDVDKGYIFPKPFNLKLRLKDIIDDNVDDNYYLPFVDLNIFGVITDFNNDGPFTICLNSKVNGKQPSLNNRVYSIYGIMPACTTSSFFMPCIFQNSRIRKLTPKECWLLMGFSIDDFIKVEECSSSTTLYKQAGNSIVVDVLVYILKNLLGDNYKYE